MSSFSTHNHAGQPYLPLEIPGEPPPALQTEVTASSEHHRDDVQRGAFSPRESEGEFAILVARQRALQKRLTTLQRQQMHEGIGRFTRLSSPVGLPDSLEMIIYGLREELERVAEQMIALKQQS